MPLGQKMAPPWRSHSLHRLMLGKHGKIFLSETIRPRALIFGMQHHLVDLYQTCSNFTPGAKNGPAPGVTCFTKAYIGKHIEKIFLSQTLSPRALLIGMSHHLVVFYQVCSNYFPGAIFGPTSGAKCFT